MRIIEACKVWRSTLTGESYEMPWDWEPEFGGWELIMTVEKMGE